MIKEHDRVILTESISKHRLEQGDIGVVIYIYNSGKAYEVEFVTLDGKTTAILELEPHQIRPIGLQEIPHARRLRAA